MSAHSAAIERAHIANQSPFIADTFHCRFCDGYKAIVGRKLAGIDGNLRHWKCARCAGGKA